MKRERADHVEHVRTRTAQRVKRGCELLVKLVETTSKPILRQHRTGRASEWASIIKIWKLKIVCSGKLCYQRAFQHLHAQHRWDYTYKLAWATFALCQFAPSSYCALTWTAFIFAPSSYEEFYPLKKTKEKTAVLKMAIKKKRERNKKLASTRPVRRKCMRKKKKSGHLLVEWLHDLRVTKTRLL